MVEKEIQQILGQIQQKISETALLERLIRQINKDFLRAGFQPVELNSLHPDEWIKQLKLALDKLKSNELNHVLYIIDIPETLYWELAPQEGGNLLLAKVILHRELMKVYYQINYQ